MKHKPKTKESKNLIYIEKESKEESSLAIAFKVLMMYESDFNLSITDIANILKCERQWVVRNIRDNVKCIFLNDIYRSFLMEVNEEHSVCSQRIYLKGYYYFSRKDFYKWLKKIL